MTRWHTSAARLLNGQSSATIIGLAELRREAGDLWEKLRGGIASRLELLLRQHLGSADFFVPIDDLTYLVVMPRAVPRDCHISCLRIAFNLHVGVFGPCSVNCLDVGCAEAHDDATLEMHPFDRVELAELARLADLEPVGDRPGAANGKLQKIQASPEEHVTVQYIPVWDSNHQMVRAYRCKAETKKVPIYTPEGYLRELTKQTLVVLSKTANSLHLHLTRGERFMMIVPVSYEVLSAPVHRMEVIAACRQLRGDLRPYLAFAIEDLPPGVPQSRMVDLVSALGGFCGLTMAKFPCQHALWTAFQGAGLKAIGIGLENLSPQEVPLEISRLAVETKRMGVSSFIQDVRNTDVLRYALDSGVQWMSGPAIAGAVDEPGPLKRLSRAQLLQDFAYL